MMRGRVEFDGRRCATVRIAVHGQAGAVREVETIVDTGFHSYLSLPSELIEALGLEYFSATAVELADGSDRQGSLFVASVSWQEQTRSIFVHDIGSREPLIGMSLLFDCRLTIDIEDGGQLTIEALR